MAEDLGYITPDVRAILDRFELPGMRVLLFAFDSGGGSDHHAPHNYVKRDYAYTGTHDNSTVRGWFEKEAGRKEKERLFSYLGCRVRIGARSRGHDPSYHDVRRGDVRHPHAGRAGPGQ